MSLEDKNKAAETVGVEEIEQAVYGRCTLPEPQKGDHEFCDLGSSRVLMYSHDTLGLGHLKRSLKIARALVEMIPGLSIRIATGSPHVDRFEFPEGVDYVQLLPVRKAGPEHYEARDPMLSFEPVLEHRKATLLKSIQDFNPSLFLVDHSPIGMGSELLPALEWHVANCPGAIRIFGMRDIIDDPDAVIKLWTQKNIYETIQRLYDHVLIYGSPSVFDPITAYRFPSALRSKSRYCNYIADQSSNGFPPVDTANSSGKRPLVLVTIGGGDGAVNTVIRNYLEMLRCRKDNVNWDSHILTGPFLNDENYDRLLRMSDDLPVKIERFVSNVRLLMRSSDLVIATGGYNTITEILSSAKRSIVIPRIMFRMEQMIRATCLEKMGLLKALNPDDIGPDIMFDTVTSMLESDDATLEDARRKDVIRFDGATRLARFVGEQLMHCRKAREKMNG